MWQTVGQDHLLRQLSGSLRSGRLGHAYLLAGPPHVGKMTLALDLAAAVNCARANDYSSLPDGEAGPCWQCDPCSRIRRGVHADLSVLTVGGDSRVQTRISIEQIRDAENFLSVTPVEGGWKVIVIDGAETLSAGQGESANALLKTLEEPPERVLLLLLTTEEQAILPTIRSRCRLLALKPMPGDALAEYLASQQGAEAEHARRLARLARGCPGWAITALDDPDVLETRSAELDRIADPDSVPLDQRFSYANTLANGFSRDRESVRQTLYLWQGWWRDLLLVKEGIPGYVQNADRRNELETIAPSVASADIVEFLKRVQTTLAALDANANARLALESMMLGVPAV
ncbi:MAG: DNA polymerase III subunit delta' [Chloroflexi bacterium]|nr:DNA polymerase III subunit delta' [Chloroflexota bacterium]